MVLAVTEASVQAVGDMAVVMEVEELRRVLLLVLEVVVAVIVVGQLEVTAIMVEAVVELDPQIPSQTLLVLEVVEREP